MANAPDNWAELIGKPAYESIAEMVAAMECDYDRMDELRDEREALADEVSEYAHVDEEDDPEQEDVDRHNEAAANLKEWDEENAEELKELEAAAGECKDSDDARDRIDEDPLDITIRGERRNGEWEADEFVILLATGGPAVRIMGELDEHGEPYRAWLEVQDWFKPWTQYFAADQDTLLSYCRCFNFAD